MREYERLRTEGKLTELVSGASMLKADKLVKDDVTTSSAGDVGSESSISDVQVSPYALFLNISNSCSSPGSCPCLEFRKTSLLSHDNSHDNCGTLLFISQFFLWTTFLIFLFQFKASEKTRNQCN